MDSFAADVTGLNVVEGQEVVILAQSIVCQN